MPERSRAALVVALALGVGACHGEHAPAGARDLSGAWTIVRATNPGAPGGYHGTVTLARKNDAYLLDWNIAGSGTYHGVALEQDDRLGAGWNDDKDAQVVVYSVDGGKLAGRSAALGAGKLGSERLEGPPGPGGTYRIVAARAPGTGATYAGTVVITPTGPSFRMHWELSSGALDGVALLDGSTLVAGRAVHGAGAILYRRVGAALVGLWTQPTNAAVGSERLERR